MHEGVDAAELRKFTWYLLRDMRALEQMLADGMFDTGPRRIGAEQELFLVDNRWQPAPLAEETLNHSTDDRLVTELTRFNLEFNLDPYFFRSDCLSKLENQLNEMLQYTRDVAAKAGAKVVLTGILPTIHLTDLDIANMAPVPRYFAINDAIINLRGGPAQYQIRGADELFFRHENILVEGCNTSFQTHFQVTPEEFPHFYNIAQLVAAPCLAAATNSPVLFGKRLWRETRIALFQQAVDTRSSNLYLREMSPRVHFGTGWLNSSVTEIYKEDISRFRVILTAELEDPFEVMAKGGIPKLKALQLHNGTVYRWNRACYGVTDGKPHLRIENRILPAGPTVLDEVANAAFWFGLVSGIAAEVDGLTDRIDFDDVKSNFIAAARLGLASQLVWLDEERLPAGELIQKHLLPLSRRGLEKSGIDSGDIDKYLGVLEERVRTNRTGSQWIVESLAKMKRNNPRGRRADRLNAVVAAMYDRQQGDQPGHMWELATSDETRAMRQMQNTRVEHFMSTDLYTVNEEELIELVAKLMDWEHIRHVLVEDRDHKLVGIVTHRQLLRHMSMADNDARLVPVKEIMTRNPITVTPSTTTASALNTLRSNQISALPVVNEGLLIGIITDRDFYDIASALLDDSITGG